MSVEILLAHFSCGDFLCGHICRGEYYRNIFRVWIFRVEMLHETKNDSNILRSLTASNTSSALLHKLRNYTSFNLKYSNNNEDTLKEKSCKSNSKENTLRDEILLQIQ